MAYSTGTTKSGESWTPEFIEHLDQANCIGCGRCYNVCTRDVFSPEEIDVDEDDAGDYDDDVRMVMAVADADNCIGCLACVKVCSKGCFTHAAQAI
ncbi:ferredoxin III, nif-specific [Psychromonas antarctica]|jgi:Nif-specific ferredoxin III|uniref:ferredoxin III, nif-specific n=1 Tax=Psychromonas antarctica TaxID=67573 RepID=UPI001EE85037|nr:ferredoxin III, nif-specific [Psychromonas antarctica]MCG6200816.1 ferredoxin III, nif-specific [Psychromonas antarctica]